MAVRPEFHIPKAPEVKFNKTGFEIRTEMLELAKGILEFNYSVKVNEIELTGKRDEKGNLVATVNFPDVPGVEQVLSAAKQLYDFVQDNSKVSK